MVTDVRGPVRRRQITEADLDAVAGLLSRGFRFRPKSYWRRGLARQAARPVPESYPRFGYLLEAGGRPVAVLLTIFSEAVRDGRRVVRCNLSSWSSEPAFAGHAALLVGAVLRDPTVTYLNLSPAPHTQPIIERQGFQPFGRGLFLSLPWLADPHERVRIHRVGERAPECLADLPERDLLEAHAGYGCTCLVAEAQDGLHPFVFAPRRILKRLVPTRHLIYCRDLAEFARFAGPLGRHLLGRGHPTVLIDADGPLPGLVGLSLARQQTRYFRGPNPPRPGEIPYTEGAIFGP
ncbi:conserved hypothetical protein [Methylobacterium sp. 4-46]|uniref:hypothetical protein n=1 Tax=unclassified Methylobacterium TaxID=2615210 RepID=UPI000152C778|nr:MULTISPECIES: hypothetical protein [Methylobacterium]ACA20780.1 conserved hypothetical protein [Methylobacterium sp. 4-46]WFT79934.1 hypothetical protein QA634_32920 [Methylobacterium nodulans]